jgi:alkaline phosphatase D
MCAQVFPDQPVWEQIAAHHPDYLVLLGDSIYLDIHVPSYPGNPGLPISPQEMDEDTFMRHLFSRYTAQLNQPQFASLMRQMPPGHTFSIWDDHDFLWNDACGAEYTKGMIQRGKVRASTAYQEAFRSALAQSLAQGSFPDSYTDAAFLDPNQAPLTIPSIPLDNRVHLHLSDGRTYRTRTWLVPDNKRTLFGKEQQDRIGASIKAEPDAIHLFASGSTLSGWKQYHGDLLWLKKLATKSRILVLSGDIHRNDTDILQSTGGYPIHEATSSGAAVRSAVVIGKKQENFGLLEIDGPTLSVRLFHKGNEQMELARRYDISSWSAL